MKWTESPESQRREDLLALFWGWAEATFFFIVPDVLITWRALENLKKALRAALFAGVGAVVGGLGMYLWGRLDPETAARVLDLVPAISGEMIRRVFHQVEAQGLVSMFVGAFTGKPYKLYAVVAGQAGLNMILFALVSFPARLLRFVLLSLAVRGLVWLLGERINLRMRRVLHLAGWTVFYFWYFSVMPW